MLLVFPLVAGIFVAAAQSAHAQTQAQAPAPADASSCAITPADLDAVTAAEAQELLVELAARRALLTKTITCAEADAAALQSNLNSLATSGSAQTMRES